MPKTSLLGPGSLKIGTTGAKEFAGQSTKTTLTPSTDYEDDIPTLDGGEVEGDATESWELGGTILQDYDLASLEIFCFDNRGTWLPFDFVPNNDNAVAWTGQVRISAVSVGGDVKKRNTSDYTFKARNVTHGTSS